MGNIRGIYGNGLDKDNEFEADHMGVVIAARAGYDPYGLMSVLNTLDSINPEEGTFALWYKTHPPAVKRLNELDKHMVWKMESYAEQQHGRKRFIYQIGTDDTPSD
jgi:predicted Zn-dependent protease